MKKIHRLLTLALPILVTQASFANPHLSVFNYNDILKALTQGNTLQVISKLNQCSPASTDAIELGGIDFKHFLVSVVEENGKKNHIIGMSNTILIKNKDSKYVYEYIRLRIYEKDNSVEFFEQELDPKDYSEVKDKEGQTIMATYQCKLAASPEEEGGITVYRA